MKKGISILLTLLLVSAMFMTVSADEVKPSGFYDIGTAANVEIKTFVGDTAVTTGTETDVDGDGDNEVLYENTDRLEVSYTAAVEDAYYGVILVEGTGLPTKDNTIFYIDQVTALSETVKFNVYPILPSKSGILTLYISSNVEGFELVSVPVSYLSAGPDYVLGDIDGNGKWNSLDALTTLQIGAGLYEATEAEKMAADVDGNGKWNSLDALTILQYGAGIIDSWN